jgi:hypothetical protein
MKNVIIFAIVAVALVVVFAVPRWKQAQRAKKSDDYFEKQYGALGKTTEEILGHENATNSRLHLGVSLRWLWLSFGSLVAAHLCVSLVFRHSHDD